jgi:hypothetical protein
MKKEKTVSITLELGEYANCLWVTKMSNRIRGQEERYEHLEGKETLDGTMYFCNSYLEAQVLRAYIKAQSGLETGLYKDQENDEDEEAWVVASPEKYT